MATKKHRTGLSRIPWKALAANAAVVGGSHALGYLGSGALSNVLARTPAVQKAWNRMTPEQQRMVASGMITTTGAAIPLSMMAAQLATQANTMEELERRRKREEGTKVASVIMTYRAALEQG